MDKNPTLLATCLKKLNQKKFPITFFLVVLLLITAVSIYFTYIANNKENVLGEEDVSMQEEISKENNSILEKTEMNSPEDPNLQESEMSTTEKTSTLTKIKIDENIANNAPTNINSPQKEEEPNFCKESDISTYRQIIATSESSIKFYEAYLANPKKDYDYTYKYEQCGWEKSDCIANAEAYFLQTTGWTYLESGSHGCSRIAICSNALKTRTEMMNACSAEKEQCLVNLDIWMANKIAEANKQIDWRKGLIIENQNKLANCGLQ